MYNLEAKRLRPLLKSFDAVRFAIPLEQNMPSGRPTWTGGVLLLIF
jgi:hypothetical protein